MKIFQSLRFQFVVIFSLFIILISGVTALLGIRQLSRAVEDTLAKQGFYIVERAASFINGDAFEMLVNSMDMDDPFYEETRVRLRELKESANCMYLYTMAQYHGDIWSYIIDGSDEPGGEHFSDFGDQDDISDYDHAFRLAIKNRKTEAAQLHYQHEWGWVIPVYTPIFNSTGKVVGMIGCDFDGNHLYDTILKGTSQSIIIGMLSIILGIVLLLFLLYKIFTPLIKIKNILHGISLGDGDLTMRINLKDKNELGELASYFNLTLDKIKNLVVKIKLEADFLMRSGTDLAANMQQTASSINQITATVMSIKQKITSQSASVTETHATMEQVTKNIGKLGKNVEAQTSSVTRSSSAIEEMLANIQSVTQTLVRNTENVRELTAVSDEGRQSLQKVSEDIKEISRESEGLLAINAVMENIAAQTNLLSMNAAIEAAHAGETGKGFAVVAGEIRKLATNSSEQSQTISNVLKRIKTAIDAISKSTGMVMQNFQAIEERVQIVSQQETNIRNAMEEQGQGSKQILEAVSDMNDNTQMVKQGTTEMLTSSNEVIQESEQLEIATAEISSGMNEMAAGAEQINTAVNQVNDISIQTKQHIETLVSEISKFKV